MAFPGRSIRLLTKAESITHFDFIAAQVYREKRNAQGTYAIGLRQGAL